MKNKLVIFREICGLYETILKNESINEAIINHSLLILDEFRSKKLFYKYIFKNNRFLAVSIAACVFYNQNDSYFSDVKSECLKTGMISENTITSLLSMLKITGRITIDKSRLDKRKIKFSFTEKGELDTLSLINSVMPALNILFPDIVNSSSLSKNELSLFFKKYYDIFHAGLYLVDLTKGAEIFITKDSGHMIMVSLFMLCQNNEIESKKSKILYISKNCGVSRSHLRNILIEANKLKLLVFDNKSGHIQILDTFNSMFRSYMAYYFSFVIYGLKVS